MPSTGTPSANTASGARGVAAPVTDAGPPESTIARGANAAISSSPMSNGRISQETPLSRTRRARSWVVCAPKSRTRTRSVTSQRTGRGDQSTPESCLTTTAGLVGLDGVLELGVLLAAEEARAVENFEMFLGLRQISDFEIQFANILVGAAVVAVALEGHPVICERLVHVAQLAVAVAQKVVPVGAVWFGLDRLVEIFDRLVEVAGVDRLPAGPEVGVARLARRRARRRTAPHEGDDGPNGHQREPEGERTSQHQTSIVHCAFTRICCASPRPWNGLWPTRRGTPSGQGE